MPTASSTLSTIKSQLSGTKPTNNNSSHLSKKRTIIWPLVSAISKKSVDAASKANHKDIPSNTITNGKTTRHFHDSKLDLSKPGKNLSSNKVVCSRSNSSSSTSSRNSCNTNNTDNTSPSSTSNSLRSLNGIEMMLDDDNNIPEITNKNGHIIPETNNVNEPLDTTIDIPQSSQHHAIKSDESANKSILSTSTTKPRPLINSVSWVEEITDKSFSSISTEPPQLDSLMNDVVDSTSSSSRSNDDIQCETLPSTNPCTRKSSTVKTIHRKLSKKKDSEKVQDNVSNNNNYCKKLMIVRTLSLLKVDLDEKVKESSKSSPGRSISLCSRSKSFNDSINKENDQVDDESIKDLSKKRNFISNYRNKKRGSMDSRIMSSSSEFSLKRIMNTSSSSSEFSSVSFDNNEMICDSPTSETQNSPTLRNKRLTLNDDLDDNVRRSWTHIEVHLKSLLFSRKRALDSKRRNSYSYTNSLKTNQQLVAESEIRIHLHKNRNSNMSVDEDTVVRDPPTLTSPSDIFALQADAEKETDVTTRSSQMRKFIACEIYSTEQSYLEHLKKLKKIFMDPFIDAAQQSNPLVNPDDIKIIFAHIDELIELSTIIVEDLESSMDPWQESESTVGEVFLKYNPYFEALLLYAENHQQSRLTIKRANENVLYRKILQSQNKQDSSRLVLSDYMIMPIQRVTRYCLLLQELKKYTPEFHMDYDDLCHAVDNMKILAIQCDKAIQRH